MRGETPPAGQREKVIRQIVALLVLALAVRVTYVLLAVQSIGLDQFVGITPDSQTYFQAARDLFGSAPGESYALYLVGPGYGLILGLLQGLFGEGYIPGICFSIVMGTLAPVAVYLFAYGIFRRTGLSLLAGLICVLSPTSLSMSGRILTDQTFFTLHCFSLVCLIEGLRKGKMKWFIFAGLLCGIGALIRPAGQFWPYLFFLLPFVLPIPRVFVSRWQFLRRTAVVGLIALAMTLSWSARNYITGGVFTFGSVGVLTARNCIVAQIDGSRLHQRIWDLRVVYEKEDGDHTLPFAQYYENMQRRVKNTIEAYPGEFVHFFFQNLWENATEPDSYLPDDFPVLKDWGWAKIWEPLKVFNRVHFLVLVLSLLWVAIDRRWSALVILGLVFGYFTMVTGFSFWQASRLHYPAEMAWAILLAYALDRLYDRARNRPMNPEGIRF
jgi:hypothetical protein